MMAYDFTPLVSKDIFNKPTLNPIFKAMISNYIEETARKIAKEEIEKFKKEFEKKQGRITE